MASENQASYTKIGFTVMIGTIAIVLALIYLGGLRGRGRELMVETYYDKAVSGLSVGSVVNFRGVKIGEVREISFVGVKYPEVEDGYESSRIYILMAVSRALISGPEEESETECLEFLREMVERGLKATVSSSGITGLSRMELDFYPDSENDAKPRKISWQPRYTYIPPRVSLLDSFSDSATKVMNQINKMDLNAAWSNINASVESLSRASSSVRVMMESRQGDLERIMDDLAEVSDATRQLTSELKRNPSLLIRERKLEPLAETE